MDNSQQAANVGTSPSATLALAHAPHYRYGTNSQISASPTLENRQLTATRRRACMQILLYAVKPQI